MKGNENTTNAPTQAQLENFVRAVVQIQSDEDIFEALVFRGIQEGLNEAQARTNATNMLDDERRWDAIDICHEQKLEIEGQLELANEFRNNRRARKTQIWSERLNTGRRLRRLRENGQRHSL